MSSTVATRPQPRALPPETPETARARPAWLWALVALITLGAAALRLYHLGAVRLDPFYDAAVRSMGRSWHNFFFGAFEPGGSVSIDKPPVDLWLQVVSVKILGFTSTALKLPEALAGTLSVPVVFAAVRRLFGPVAGLGAALAIAVLPIEVLTARSDTMDAVMMALIALAFLLIVLAGERGSTPLLCLAAAALGLAFNVKLLEALVPLAGLALLALLGLPGRPRRRLGQIALAGVVFVAVSLSWLGATLLFGAHERPYAIGSTNGSAWNAAFIFNGRDRIIGKVRQGDFPNADRHKRYPERTQAERDHIPIPPPAANRLLLRIGPLSGERLGFELLAALLLGVPAFVTVLRARAPAGARTPARPRGETVEATPAGAPAPETAPTPAGETVEGTPAGAPTSAAEPAPEQGGHAFESPPVTEGTRRLQRAAVLGLSLWLATGIALFSQMARLHPRYVEAFTPAVAATLGIGVAWATSRPSLVRLGTLALALLVLVGYAYRLLYGTTAVWWVTVLAALAALAVLAAVTLAPARKVALAPAQARHPAARLGALAGAHTRWAAFALVLAAVLAIPLKVSTDVVRSKVSDAGNVGGMKPAELRTISTFLTSHRRGSTYEVAAASATKVASLVVRDAQPVVVMTTYDARELVTIDHLRRLIAGGQVRYALIGGRCGPRTPPTDAACSQPARWVAANGTDISRRAGLDRSRVLYRLPQALG